MLNPIITEFSFVNLVIAFAAAWGLSIIIKVVIEISKNQRFDWYYFVTDGGFPSSHSTLVTSVATATFFYSGFSLLTFIVVAFAFIIIRDALGVRTEVGKQRLILQKIVPKESRNLRREGHTLKQVLSGIALGLIVTVVMLLIL
jgi:acid phosphatase family membrane protein YuiD